jgi:xylulokinase
MDHYGLGNSLVPNLVPSFGNQGDISSLVARETGLPAGIPVSYRAGDQPNNALSLNVFNPGEVAATAGTSGVIYGILDKLNADMKSRVNLFAHVNHSAEKPRLGVLLCVNGTGIQYSWLRNQVFGGQLDYPEMNSLATTVQPGSDGLQIFPFGNGVERILQNRAFGGQIRNLDFNRHGRAHMIRAAQEGIIFALNYGFEAMRDLGVKTQTVRAGAANMFQSELFCELFASITGTTVELYNTDGSVGAARGAGIGAGFFSGPEEAFNALQTVQTIEPKPELKASYEELYNNWKFELEKLITNEK